MTQVPARVYDVVNNAGTELHRVTVDNEGIASCDPKCKAAVHGQMCWHVKAAKVIDHRTNLRKGREQ